MGKLFGTDGVRGVANQDLTPEVAFRVARAGTYGLLKEQLESAKGQQTKPRVVVGMDTRLSGPMLEAAVIAGITSVGADAVRLGIIPTPGVAYLTRETHADAGIMISASHNPVPDNGIKFFDCGGFKLPDDLEEEIEAFFYAELDRMPRPTGEGVGTAIPCVNPAEQYTQFIVQSSDQYLMGQKIVLDCGFGAAYKVAPRAFRALGAEVIEFNSIADGRRINVDCGSTNPEYLQEMVVKNNAHLGFAFDGDADRVVAVDEKGNLVDGDHIMAILALDLLERGKLPEKAIAATVYSNLGLNEVLESAGGRVITTQAGDRYVLAAMLEHGLVLGGEQSGHIIMLDYNTTGDGILTAVQLASTLKRREQTLSQAVKVMRTFPQILESVRVEDKEEVAASSELKELISRAQEILGPQGRIFVRPSGTEPLIRVMGEGPFEEKVKAAVKEVVEGIKNLK
ncbi:MAG: phosphoglucosamine mutase [Firmicutes bacterium]|nr:phosphoglucosamine mutase [Bacillota bacterium]